MQRTPVGQRGYVSLSGNYAYLMSQVLMHEDTVSIFMQHDAKFYLIIFAKFYLIIFAKFYLINFAKFAVCKRAG